MWCWYYVPATQSIVRQSGTCKWKLLKVKVAQSCLTLCDPMNYSVHAILQARIPEWVAYPFYRGSSQPRDRTQVSLIAGRFFTSWATREAQDHGYSMDSPDGQCDITQTSLWTMKRGVCPGCLKCQELSDQLRVYAWHASPTSMCMTGQVSEVLCLWQTPKWC